MQCGGRIRSVQRRQHEVSGERGLNRDARRVGITNLTDQDDVGVLTQQCPQTGGERQSGLLVGLHLVDAGEHVFHGILDGGDVLARVVDLEKRRVQRRCFSGSGGSGTDDHAERRTNHLRERFVGVARHAEFAESDHRATFVEQPHHQFLAEDGGHGGHAHVHLTTIDHRGELAVLRSTTFDDVHARHDLQTTHQAEMHRQRQPLCLHQVAVDAVANAQDVVEGLDMDVGCAIAESLSDDVRDEVDDGCVIIAARGSGEVGQAGFDNGDRTGLGGGLGCGPLKHVRLSVLLRGF